MWASYVTQKFCGGQLVYYVSEKFLGGMAPTYVIAIVV